MSHDVRLIDSDGSPVAVDVHEEGGTYVLGGTSRAELNITYNYSKFYYEHLDRERGLMWLNGKKAAGSIGRLEHTVTVLGVRRDSDYWKPTQGNAGYALAILLKWARNNPEATFEVD